MKICGFGTARIDMTVYNNIKDIEIYDETKTDKMIITLGGSVCNTFSVLSKQNKDITLYILNSNDSFSDFVKMKLNQNNIKFVSCPEEQNNTATTLIFVDETGNKKMISYDGIRQDKYILQKLLSEINEYDLFYTSFYEINFENYKDISKIMSLSKKTFVDLSPLIYQIDKKVLNKILTEVDIISGTEDEYNILFKKLHIGTKKEFQKKYSIEIMFIKQGDKGATLCCGKREYSYAPKLIKESLNTTACGDTFNASVILSISKDISEQEMLQNAVETASKVAYEGFETFLRTSSC